VDGRPRAAGRAPTAAPPSGGGGRRERRPSGRGRC
jgi:hypothetical protein